MPIHPTSQTLHKNLGQWWRGAHGSAPASRLALATRIKYEGNYLRDARSELLVMLR